MISNQILQSNIDGLKEITRIDLCVCDVEGKVLASTFEQAEEYESSILAFADSPADSQVISGYQFFKVFDDHQLEYILLANEYLEDITRVSRIRVEYKSQARYRETLVIERAIQEIEAEAGTETHVIIKMSGKEAGDVKAVVDYRLTEA